MAGTVGSDLLVGVVSGLLVLWIAPRWKYWASQGWRAWWEERWPNFHIVLLGGTFGLLLQALAQYSDLYLMLMGLSILCLTLVHAVCLRQRDKRKQQISGS